LRCGRTPPPRRRRLVIAVPLSYGSTEHKPLLRALKWGVLGRIAAVFRVDEILLYESPLEPVDNESKKLAVEVLRYLVVAPYLRRKVFPLSPYLRYAGVLPPLQLPTHGVGGPRRGECRQALITAVQGDVVSIDAGLGKQITIRVNGSIEVSPGTLILVEVVAARPPRLRLGCGRPVYNGYAVKAVGSLRAAIKSMHGGLIVGTSRLGSPFDHNEARRVLEKAERVAVFFGSPWRGLAELAQAEGLDAGKVFDRIWNTVPCQGTRTVRVEEAVASTLALINLHLG